MYQVVGVNYNALFGVDSVEDRYWSDLVARDIAERCIPIPMLRIGVNFVSPDNLTLNVTVALTVEPCMAMSEFSDTAHFQCLTTLIGCVEYSRGLIKGYRCIVQ